MGELSIKIKIGDREYPMKVDSSEEEKLRVAGKLVNEKMKFYKDHFGINDKQDLLAMVAFDFMVDRIKFEGETKNFNNNLSNKISLLDSLVNSALIE